MKNHQKNFEQFLLRISLAFLSYFERKNLIFTLKVIYPPLENASKIFGEHLYTHKNPNSRHKLLLLKQFQWLCWWVLRMMLMCSLHVFVFLVFLLLSLFLGGVELENISANFEILSIIKIFNRH